MSKGKTVDAESKTGYAGTPDGLRKDVLPVEDTVRDVEYGSERDAEVDAEKNHVPGMTHSD